MTEATIISADSHVFEPVDLWEKRLDRKFRERGPRFVSDYQGKPGTWFVCEGINPRPITSIAATGVAKEDLVKFKDVHHKDLRPGGWDPAARLEGPGHRRRFGGSALRHVCHAALLHAGRGTPGSGVQRIQRMARGDVQRGRPTVS